MCDGFHLRTPTSWLTEVLGTCEPVVELMDRFAALIIIIIMKVKDEDITAQEQRVKEARVRLAAAIKALG